MGQLPHLSISGTAPVDITESLAAGRYVAQVQGDSESVGVRYATAPAAPDNPQDYFVATGRQTFRFAAGCEDRRCWVLNYGLTPAEPVLLAIAKV